MIASLLAFIIAHWEIFAAALALLALLVKLTPTPIDDLIVGFARKILDAFKPKAPAPTLGERIAAEKPVIAEPAPGTPAAALKAVMDAKLGEPREP